MSPEHQWAKVPESVAYAGLDATAMRVLITMSAKAGRDRVTWITQRTMGERLGLHRTTVGKAIRRLEKLGFVKKSGRVVVDYDLGTWVQKYKVAPYQPEERLGSASGFVRTTPDKRLGGTRRASRQGADENLGRSHSVPYRSVPQTTRANGASSSASRLAPQDQDRSEEEERESNGNPQAITEWLDRRIGGRR
jgi:Helix-turn-helix domain